VLCSDNKNLKQEKIFPEFFVVREKDESGERDERDI